MKFKFLKSLFWYVLLFILDNCIKARLIESFLTNFIAKKCLRSPLHNFLSQKIAKIGNFFPPTRLFHPTRLLDTLEYEEQSPDPGCWSPDPRDTAKLLNLIKN